MTPEQVHALVVSDNDQYEAAARDWVERTPWNEVMMLWSWLQKEHSDSYTELATLFASITIAPMIAEKFKNMKETP